VDRADLPLHPDSPKKLRNLLLALFLGLFGGLGLALVMEYLDNTVKSAEDVERYSGLPTLGVVPVFDKEATLNGHYYAYRSGEGTEDGKKSKKKDQDRAKQAEAEGSNQLQSIELITHFAPDSTFAESYRSLRTALLLSGPVSNLKSLMITSPLPNEGKSVTISNLAASLARWKRKSC